MQNSRAPVNDADYPRASRSIISSINNVQATSGLLKNSHNFSRTTSALLYEFSSGQPLIERELDEDSGLEYLKVSTLAKTDTEPS